MQETEREEDKETEREGRETEKGVGRGRHTHTQTEGETEEVGRGGETNREWEANEGRRETLENINRDSKRQRKRDRQ